MPFDLSCPDWVERLKSGRPPMAEIPLDDAAADRAVSIFDNLRLPDVAGQPLLSEAGGDWFRAILRAAFGAIEPDTGERAVSEIFCLVPKKNSKTTNSAALGIVALLMNETPNAEMLIVGPTKEVANTCFSQARGMIEADPVDPDTGRSYLQDRFHVRDHKKEIHDRLTGASLKIKSFDMRVVTGAIPKLTIIDELHVLGTSHHAAAVLAQIRGGMITRPDALLVFITTQSDGPPAGVFKTELQYARGVRDGQIKGGTLLPCLFEFPEAMQLDQSRPWADPKTWPMVLPNLGKSITIGRLIKLWRAACEKGEAEKIRWASQHLNIQIGLGLHNDAWVGAEFWLDAAAPATLDEILAQSDCVTIGIDGGGLDDLLALAVIGRDRETRVWRSWVRAWAQKSVLTRRKDIAPRLEDFDKLGELVICDRPGADFEEVAEICARIRDLGLLPEKYAIGLDPQGVASILDAFARHEIEGETVTAIPQGYRLSGAVWECERRLAAGTLRPAAQELAAWSASNAKVEQRGNAVLITKAVSGKAKIDPLIAILNAAQLMGANPEAAGVNVSPWDDPDFALGAA
jgi:phage terminase large subunit-like protein